MAVVKGPALSIAASGNLGAICYSRWRELQVARDSWTGTVPNTSAQQVYQANITTLSQYWGNVLTEEDREAWRAEARVAEFSNRFGEKVHYSGYTLFMSRNMNVLRWYTSPLDRPVKGNGNMQWALYLMAASTGQKLLYRNYNYTPMGIPFPDGWEGWYAGPYDSAGRRALENEYRFEFWNPGITTYKYVAGMSAGKYYWMRMRLTDDSGLVSPYQYNQVYVT